MKRAQYFTGDLATFLASYKYQPTLTSRLDSLVAARIDQALVNEIVLWKVNRFVPLDEDALAALNQLSEIAPGGHRDAEAQLLCLLSRHGVDLPMASTLMRFRNPIAFQIIDRHSYRAVVGAKYPLRPGSKTGKKVSLYFDYLDQLIVISQDKNVNFRELDRILYVFDKQLNGKL